MSDPGDGDLVSSSGEESQTMEQVAHKLYSKAHKEYHTEITSPDAMATLDVAGVGLISSEFQGTGLDTDVRAFRNWKRINWIAKDRKRAGETERMVEANAQKDSVGDLISRKLIGDINK